LVGERDWEIEHDSREKGVSFKECSSEVASVDDG